MDGVTASHTREVNIAGLNEALLTLGGLDDLLGETTRVRNVELERTQELPESGVGHGKSGRASALLGLDDLVASELDTLDQSLKLVFRNVDRRLGLAEEGNNGLSRVTANDGNGGLGRVLLADDFGNKGFGADNVKGGDAKELLGVEDASGLEDLGSNGHGGVYRVGDDEDVGVGAVLSDALDEIADNASVDLEEVIPAHTGLACGC